MADGLAPLTDASLHEAGNRRALRLRHGYRSLLVQMAVVAGLLALVAVTIAGVVPGSRGRLGSISPAWIAAAVAAELVACAAYALLFRGVFSYGEYLVGSVRSAQIAVGELAGFVVSPTGAGGPALRIWALLRGGMPFRVVMVRSVTQYAIFEFPYLVAAVLLGVGVLAAAGIGHAPAVVALAPLGVVVVAAMLVLVLAHVSRRPARSQAHWRRIGRDVIEAIPDGVRQIPSRLGARAWLPLPAAAYWVGDCAVLVLSCHAVHGSASIGVIALAYMLGQLGNALPLPGGVGGVEPLMLGVLTSSGVNLGLDAAAVVLYRFISLGLQSLLGAAAISTLVPTLQRERSRPGSQRARG